MEPQKIPHSQNNLEKEEQSWRHPVPLFQNRLQSYSKQNSMVSTFKEKNRHKD